MPGEGREAIDGLLGDVAAMSMTDRQTDRQTDRHFSGKFRATHFRGPFKLYIDRTHEHCVVRRNENVGL